MATYLCKDGNSVSVSSRQVPFNTLLGKTITNIKVIEEQYENEIIFACGDEYYRMYHDQSCCESVSINDICGNLDNLIGEKIVFAEESSSNEDNFINPTDIDEDCIMWTFYKLASVKGWVDIRWHGESNGYYSVEVEFDLIEGQLNLDELVTR